MHKPMLPLKEMGWIQWLLGRWNMSLSLYCWP